MECKCKYYRRNAEGELVCTVCGKPAKPKTRPGIEDKIEERHETKIRPAEVKKSGRPGTK